MYCKKCGGRVCVDRVYTDSNRLELNCMLCGKRIFVSEENTFGRWLTRREEELKHSFAL